VAGVSVAEAQQEDKTEAWVAFEAGPSVFRSVSCK
jgi:hypothetical protein